MSKHYVHKFKHTHTIRKNTFMAMVKSGKAEIIEKGKAYWVIETTNADYKVSRRGIVHKLKEQQNEQAKK